MMITVNIQSTSVICTSSQSVIVQGHFRLWKQVATKRGEGVELFQLNYLSLFQENKGRNCDLCTQSCAKASSLGPQLLSRQVLSTVLLNLNRISFLPRSHVSSSCSDLLAGSKTLCRSPLKKKKQNNFDRAEKFVRKYNSSFSLSRSNDRKGSGSCETFRDLYETFAMS